MGHLTKKDFEKIAEIIRENKDWAGRSYKLDVDYFIKDLCEYLKTTNGQFNETEFKRLCGVVEE